MKVNRTNLAKELEVSKPYITKLVHKGILIFDENKEIDLEVAKKAIQDNSDPAKAYKKKDQDIQTTSLENEPFFMFGLNPEEFRNKSETLPFNETKTKLLQADLYQKKLKIDEAEKVLIQRAVVEKMAFEIAKVLKDKLLQIPGRSSASLAAETDQQQVYVILEKEIKSCLEECALSLTRMEF